ncbi:MAG: hypothetical protein GXO15_04025 [Crenarchaeota archaeon]|nr:hypothetical protein [Thermoproteota archaeon]
MPDQEYVQTDGKATTPSNGLYMDGERLIVLPLRSCGAMIEAIRDLVGDMAAGPLYYLGKRIGQGLVNEVSKRVKGKGRVEDVAHAVGDLLEELGFGKISIIDADNETATLKLYSPPSIIGMRLVSGKEKSIGGGTSRGFCHLERGIIAAIFEEILGRRVKVLEAEAGEESGKPYCTLKLIAFDSTVNSAKRAYERVA